jgi:Flp pilus assembly pilin Flp
MSRLIRLFHKDESGQDLVEYSLVLVAVGAAVVAGNATLATDFGNWMNTLNGKINTDLGG